MMCGVGLHGSVLTIDRQLVQLVYMTTLRLCMTIPAGARLLISTTETQL